MKRTTREIIQHVKAGDPISARLINNLIDAAKQVGVPPQENAWTDQSGPSVRSKSNSSDRLSWIRCLSRVNAPPFSVVEVFDSTVDLGGPLLRVRQAGQIGTGTGTGTGTAVSAPALYAANEDYPLYANSLGWVKLVTPYEPVKIRASGSVNFLDDLDVSGLQVISGAGKDLLCLTPDDVESRCYVLGRTSGAQIKWVKILGGFGTGTGTAGYQYVTKTSSPYGFSVVDVDESSDSEIGTPYTCYADYTRSVFAEGDILAIVKKGSKWQIISEGPTSWTAVAIDSISSSGYVSLYWASGKRVHVQAHLYDSSDSLTPGTTCLVLWSDGEQRFYALPVSCPASVISVI